MTLYEILGVSESASTSEIKKSYHHLVKKYHPDIYKVDDTKFKGVQQAWEVLRDPVKRVNYDIELYQNRTYKTDWKSKNHSSNSKGNSSSKKPKDPFLRNEIHKTFRWLFIRVFLVTLVIFVIFFTVALLQNSLIRLVILITLALYVRKYFSNTSTEQKSTFNFSSTLNFLTSTNPLASVSSLIFLAFVLFISSASGLFFDTNVLKPANSETVNSMVRDASESSGKSTQNKCLDLAQSEYYLSWNKECLLSGEKTQCPLSLEKKQELLDSYAKAKDECLKRFP